MRAVIYARYSSDKQSDRSIEDQVRLCRERIAGPLAQGRAAGARTARGRADGQARSSPGTQGVRIAEHGRDLSATRHRIA